VIDTPTGSGARFVRVAVARARSQCGRTHTRRDGDESNMVRKPGPALRGDTKGNRGTWTGLTGASACAPSWQAGAAFIRVPSTIPISARIAEDLGFEAGMFAGSVASSRCSARPNIVVLTLTEFAEQAYRIKSRPEKLPLLVDADHGYGTR